MFHRRGFVSKDCVENKFSLKNIGFDSGVLIRRRRMLEISELLELYWVSHGARIFIDVRLCSAKDLAPQNRGGSSPHQRHRTIKYTGVRCHISAHFMLLLILIVNSV